MILLCARSAVSMIASFALTVARKLLAAMACKSECFLIVAICYIVCLCCSDGFWWSSDDVGDVIRLYK